MSRSPHRPPAETAAPRPGLPLVVLATLAVLVTAADTYVVVLALPDILAGVGVGIDELQHATPIIGGFLLGYTATLPLLGRLADLRGRVPVLVGCLVAFALGSLLTATATGLAAAVSGRALQGIGAAVLAVADWRAIFWLNLLLGLALAAGLVVTGRGRRPDPLGLVLALVACA